MRLVALAFELAFLYLLYRTVFTIWKIKYVGPDVIIENPDSTPQVLRWHLFPRNPFGNLYVHKFLCSDWSRDLHDHPWWNVSLLLSGSYYEESPLGKVGRDITPGRLVAASKKMRWIKHSGSLVFRRAIDPHRVILVDETKPVWSLFLTGRKTRKWGFHTFEGFVEYEKYIDADRLERYKANQAQNWK